MIPRTYDVFGIAVSCTSELDLALQIENWAKDNTRSGQIICFSDTHGLVQGHDNQSMNHALSTADIVVPDGHPIAWIGRALHGLPAQRTSGPDLFELVLSRSPQTGLKHYLFGGKPGVADELAETLRGRHPGINVVGSDSPPMGSSSPGQVDKQIARINTAKPDVVWIGLGAPKQEIWMAQYRDRLPGLTLCGIGAAFDFQTGHVQRAPLWMRQRGFEWAHRWWSEPKRLGPRYLRTIRRFFILLTRQVWRMAWAGLLRRTAGAAQASKP
jgi:N-acetylglucosaminyldiphosphoundecaprenol N-acetyl-beta-D-mannosaminyltransferase